MSTKERGTLVLLAQGHNAKEIASLMGVSPHYIYALMRLLRARFGARSTSEIVLRAVAEGVITLDGKLVDLEDGNEHPAHRR